MTKFLQDSYNGIYKIVLEPYMPRLKTILLLVAGVVIGLFWAYVLAPTIFFDGDPSSLQQSWQDEWVKLLADRNAAANFDVSQNLVDLLSRIDDPLEVVDRLAITPGEELNADRLQAIRPLAEQAQASAAAAPSPSLLGNLVPFIIAPLIATIIAVVVALLWGLLLKGNVYDPLMRRLRGEKDSAESIAIRQVTAAAKQAEATSRTDFATSSLGAPIIQRMTTYLPAYNSFDETFSVEDAADKFLGECGVSIAEDIGTDGSTKPTAFEVWLFDKDDYVRTMTHTYASGYAYNDPAMRARFQQKGPVTQITPGATVTVETASLRLQARIVDIKLGSDPSLPANSYFEKVTFELAVWPKQSTTAPTPVTVPVSATAAAPNSGFAAPVMTPPPAPVHAPPTVSYMPPPAAPYMPPSQQPAAPKAAPQVVPLSPPPLRPLTPPQNLPAQQPGSLGDLARPPRPAPPPINDEEDPFGGTGDFTPVN